MPSDSTSNNAVMRKQLGIILWAEVALMGVLIVDFALRPLVSGHGFGLLIVGTAAAVQIGMAAAIFAVRGPSGARGGQLTAGEGSAMGISLVAVIALLIAWIVELPHPGGPLLVATTAVTLAILGLVVAMRRRRVWVRRDETVLCRCPCAVLRLTGRRWHASRIREDGRKPLLDARGALLVEDLCRRTGLDQETVDSSSTPGVLRVGWYASRIRIMWR